jgi:two-component system response regulator AlgR
LRNRRKPEEEFAALRSVHRNVSSRATIRGFERHLSAEGDAHREVLLRGVPEALPVSRRQQSIAREIGRDEHA